MSVSNLYFFCGEETFLMDERIAQLCAGIPDRDFFEGKGCEVSGILSSLVACSMFFSRKVVLIKNPSFLSKSIDDSELKMLQQIVSEAMGGPHIVIIYMSGERLDQRRKAVTLLKKSAEFVEFQPFKDWEQDRVVQWLQQRVKSLGKSIEMSALLALVQMGGQNLRVLASELEKLYVYVGDRGSICVEDVHASSGGISARWFSFNEALKMGDVVRLLKTSRLLMESGEDPVKLVGGVHASLRLYLQMVYLDSQGMDSHKIALVLGKNPYFVKQLIGSVKRSYSIEKLKRIYRALNQKDFEIKSGVIDSQLAVELVLFEVGK